jgi:integrase
MASITQRGDSWFAQVRIKKQGVIVFTESKTFPSKPLAESWAERLEDKLKKDGVSGTAQRSITVGDLVLTHLAYLKKLRPIGRSCIHTYEAAATEFAKVKVSEFTSKHLVDYAVRRKALGLAPSTINADVMPVSAALHAAPFAHGVRVDPTELDLAIKYLHENHIIGKSREVTRLVDDEEEEALLEEFARRNLHHQTSIDMVKIYHFALAFPRRASEITRIRWADVDFKRRTVIIRDVKHPKRKIGNDQVVPLLGKAWDILEAMPKLEERIFPHNPESMEAAFERARNRIAVTGIPKIKDLRFHDLRHTGITMLFWAGLKIEEVAQVSGHTNWQTLKRYTHIRPEDVHRRWDALHALRV